MRFEHCQMVQLTSCTKQPLLAAPHVKESCDRESFEQRCGPPGTRDVTASQGCQVSQSRDFSSGGQAARPGVSSGRAAHGEELAWTVALLGALLHGTEAAASCRTLTSTAA